MSNSKDISEILKHLLPIVVTSLVLLVSALIIAMSALSLSSASQATCSVCHSSQARQLSRSAHKDLRCSTCHREPGITGLVLDKISYSAMTLAQINPVRRYPAPAYVSDKSCLKCHRDILGKTISANAIRVEHASIAEGRLPCGDCHNTVAHGNAVSDPKRVEMRKCIICHNNGGLDANCDTCHIEGERQAASKTSAWRIAHGKNWRRTHGMYNLSSCAVCHQANFCVHCHNVSLPHRGSFLKDHGPEARRFKANCLECHSGEKCDRCHKGPGAFPHKKDFLQRHPSIVSKNGKKLCLRCHNKSACDTCHARHIHPAGRDKNGRLRTPWKR